MGRFVRSRFIAVDDCIDSILSSSQSVARLNTSWSNNPKLGARAQKPGKGGFGGRDDLEQTRRYRSSNESQKDGGYGMVFDVGDNRSGLHRRKRSPSPHRQQRRSRSRSPRREKDQERQRNRDRDDRRR